jgi:hypothetical protein
LLQPAKQFVGSHSASTAEVKIPRHCWGMVFGEGQEPFSGLPGNGLDLLLLYHDSLMSPQLAIVNYLFCACFFSF